MNKGWSKNQLTSIIGGTWIVEPTDDWRCWNLAILPEGCVGQGTLFIAIDKERWLQGSGNRGVYGDWTDTHTNLPKHKNKIAGAIVERHIEGMDASSSPLLCRLIV
jgi:hypothetical protein